MKKRLAGLTAVALASLIATTTSHALTLSASGPVAAIEGPAPAQIRLGEIAEMTVSVDGAVIRTESSNCDGQKFYWLDSTAGTMRVRIASLEWTYKVRFVWVENDAQCETCPGGGDLLAFSSSDDSSLQGATLLIADCLAPYDLVRSTSLPRTPGDIDLTRATTSVGSLWGPDYGVVFMVQVRTAIVERTWSQVKNVYR